MPPKQKNQYVYMYCSKSQARVLYPKRFIQSEIKQLKAERNYRQTSINFSEKCINCYSQEVIIWKSVSPLDLVQGKILCSLSTKYFVFFSFIKRVIFYTLAKVLYTEPSYHSFMYSLVSLLSCSYLLPAMHSLLVTLYVAEY